MGLGDKIKVITGNSDYRIGDVVDRIGRRWEHSAKQVKYDSKYNGTILQRYLRLCDRHEKLNSTYKKTPRSWCSMPLKSTVHMKNSRSLLLRLIQERVRTLDLPRPGENELVVHLRMGDVIVDIKGCMIKRIVSYVRKNAIRRVSLLTCFAYQDWSNESKAEYLAKNPRATVPEWQWTPQKHANNIARFNELEKILLQELPDVELDVISSTNVDDDMCYAAMANHFIPSMGGFSVLLQQISTMRRTRTNVRLEFLSDEVVEKTPVDIPPLEKKEHGASHGLDSTTPKVMKPDKSATRKICRVGLVRMPVRLSD